MRLFFLVISISLLSNSFAQDSTKYRFSFSVSAFSMMNYGLRDLKNVPSPLYEQYYKVYNTETYTLDYQNFSFSKGINFNISGTVLNTRKFYLKIGANVFFEKYKEKLTYTLTDIGDGSLVDFGNYIPPFTEEHVQLGYSEIITFSDNRMAAGALLGVVLFRKLKRNWNIGAGLFYVTRVRSEWYDWKNPNSYGPWIDSRGGNSYWTKQIGVSMEVSKTWKRLNIFLNLSQTVLTTKKNENKGGYEFKDMQPMVPLSQNLDFRFPLIIRSGVAVEFGKIKSEEFRIIGTPSF